MDTPTPTEYGFHATLTRSTKSAFGNDVMNVTLEMYLETSTRLHFKVNARGKVIKKIKIIFILDIYRFTKDSYDQY